MQDDCPAKNGIACYDGELRPCCEIAEVWIPHLTENRPVDYFQGSMPLTDYHQKWNAKVKKTLSAQRPRSLREAMQQYDRIKAGSTRKSQTARSAKVQSTR